MCVGPRGYIATLYFGLFTGICYKRDTLLFVIHLVLVLLSLLSVGFIAHFAIA